MSTRVREGAGAADVAHEWDEHRQDECGQLLRGLHRRPGDRARRRRARSPRETALSTSALYPTRFAAPQLRGVRPECGLPQHPVEDLIAFHIVFGKTVPDVCLNAVANLGYAEAASSSRSTRATPATSGEVIGLEQNSNGRTGVVWVRSTAVNQRGEVASTSAAG